MKIKFLFTSIFLFLLFIHPLGFDAQADESTNKSVADSYEENNGQPSKEESEENKEDTTPTQQESQDKDTSENGSNPPEIEGNVFILFVQMLFALAVVIILIVFLIRFVGKKSQAYQSSKTVQNLGGVPLGSNKSIQLIKVGGSVLVVGVGESIQLLKEVTEEADLNQINQQPNVEMGTDQNILISRFFNWLKQPKWMGQATNKKNTDFKNLLEKQLKDVKESQREIHAAIKEKDE